MSRLFLTVLMSVSFYFHTEAIVVSGLLQVVVAGHGQPAISLSPSVATPRTAEGRQLRGIRSPSRELKAIICERRDSNPHGLPHWILSPARLPIPPLSRVFQISDLPNPITFTSFVDGGSCGGLDSQCLEVFRWPVASNLLQATSSPSRDEYTVSSSPGPHVPSAPSRPSGSHRPSQVRYEAGPQTTKAEIVQAGAIDGVCGCGSPRLRLLTRDNMHQRKAPYRRPMVGLFFVPGPPCDGQGLNCHGE